MQTRVQIEYATRSGEFLKERLKEGVDHELTQLKA
jgi:hypothetical protein